MSRFPTGYAVLDDRIADAHRAREADWRAMHRRPDAEPLPDEPEPASWLGRLASAIRTPRISWPRFGS
jgi:hypothetical protein